ncbi:AMP-binding protein [Inquilinus sp. CAU 1745]|uniref:phenylacetate--CoA ligase family protein n=1 Tax=Inquilinus sp. CAU 1745 TaxID=3140369 RepID=UPI00325B0542
MTDHYDELETRDPEVREAALMAALPGQIAHARTHAPAYARLLQAVDPEAIVSREALAALPVIRKSDLPEMQRADPPFGGLATVAPGRARRIYASPGPIYDPEGDGEDYWRTARALHATGFRRGDVAHNCFSYHFTPAGAMFETGAQALGCAVVPAGVGNTELQARAIADIRPKGYIGTPDFLKIILEKGDELGLDTTSIRIGHVSGGPLLPPLKTFYEGRGIDVFQGYGTADLGLVAYETPAREGLVLAEGVIVEIVRPGTGDPAPEGEVGEVVVTTFSPAYPLIRFATGDLSAFLLGTSPCGRTNRRIRGWMGRADQTTKVRGMFVHPGQVAETLKRHDLSRGRLTVDAPDGQDRMTLTAEAADPSPGLAEKLAETLQSLTKLRGTVTLAAPGSLPNDGKTIDDRRTLG